MSSPVSNAPEVNAHSRNHSSSEWGNAVDRAKANDAGIEWQRPEEDHRSAEDIINASPLLKNLGNQSGVKDRLRERVGDFEHDADAAYRANQVMDHIERFDENGDRVVSDEIGNGSVNGFTRDGEAYHGTEAGRLQDFGKYGWENLKGQLQYVHQVDQNEKRREAADKAGIVWALPEGDKRSAQDIIDENPLLKDLGNQSGMKDALKEQVGDFDRDANAAFRAIQVIDRVVGYDENGKALAGDDVANSSVDGFTSSGEARHGTEAGRLQDFGKYGFESLAKPVGNDEAGSYKDFLKSHPDADAGSRQIAQYGAILDTRYDSIRGKSGADGAVTEHNIKDYLKQNPQLSKEEKEALNFFAQPGVLRKLDTASNSIGEKSDGKISREDVQNWLKKFAPSDAQTLASLVTEVATGNIIGHVDTSKLDKDIFEHPGKYKAGQKAAVLLELQQSQRLVVDGANAGVWNSDYGKVSIAQRSGAHWRPDKLLQDINDHLSILRDDKETVDYIKSAGDQAVKTLFQENPSLKDAVNRTYDEKIRSGSALDAAWDANTQGGKTDQHAVLASFYATATSLQSILGIDDAKAIQGAVARSSHNEDFKTFYKDHLASGDHLRDLLKNNTPEQAASEFGLEAALYGSALDPEFTSQYDKQMNDNFSSIIQQKLFKNASFENLKAIFGKDGGQELDEEKVRKLIDQMRKESPELLLNQDGTVATTDQVLAGFRGNWDMFRQGTKTLDKMGKLADFDSNGGAKGAYGSGVLHGVSGLFLAGVTIARGAQGSGKLTDRNVVDIASGSVQTTTLLIEGGSKGYQEHLAKSIKNGEQTLKEMKDGKAMLDLLDEVKDNVKDGRHAKVVAKNFEDAAKGIGGLAGIVAGAYGIFDGVNALRRGDKLTGGFGITAGSLGALAGSASTAEGGLGLLGANLPRFLPGLAATAGVLGFLGAGVAVLAALIPDLVKEGQAQSMSDKFGDLLGDAIKRYGIDGIKDGTVADIPAKDWPGGEGWTS
ncbi:type III effector HrpK domain-containing protein [Pseudomonas sp. GNP013]